MNILKTTQFENLGERREGKVRDSYNQGAKTIFITTDRHSSFDRIIAHVPFKGQVLNLTSAFWFDRTKDIIPNHVLEIPDPAVTVAKTCQPLPVEAVMRGFLTGVTSTSIWTHYQQGKRDFGNFTLPDGMYKNQQLLEPVFTPSTKAADHDETLSPDEMVARGIVTKERIKEIEDVSRKLFLRGQEIARKKGLILVDTKYEFGLDENGALTLIDEIHTPDSSRYWHAGSYEERLERGEEPEYFDKEFLRLWFNDHCDPYKDETLPEAPEDLVQTLSERYVGIYKTLTDEEPGAISDNPDPHTRIKNNLAEYVI